MPDYGYLSPTAGNPAWPSIALLLGVPALVMDQEMGLWPRAGSTKIVGISTALHFITRALLGSFNKVGAMVVDIRPLDGAPVSLQDFVRA